MKLDYEVWTDEAILAEFQRDMILAHAGGLKIDMSDVGLTTANNRYIVTRNCAVCAAGALLVGEPHQEGGWARDIAYFFGKPISWGAGLFNATDPENEPWPECSGKRGPAYRAGWKLGKRIYQWVKDKQAPGGKLWTPAKVTA